MNKPLTRPENDATDKVMMALEPYVQEWTAGKSTEELRTLISEIIAAVIEDVNDGWAQQTDENY